LDLPPDSFFFPCRLVTASQNNTVSSLFFRGCGAEDIFLFFFPAFCFFSFRSPLSMPLGFSPFSVPPNSASKTERLSSPPASTSLFLSSFLRIFKRVFSSHFSFLIRAFRGFGPFDDPFFFLDGAVSRTGDVLEPLRSFYERLSRFGPPPPPLSLAFPFLISFAHLL